MADLHGLFEFVDALDHRASSRFPRSGLAGLGYSLDHYAVYSREAVGQAGGVYDQLVFDTFVLVARITRQGLPAIDRVDFHDWLDNSLRNHLAEPGVTELLRMEAVDLRPAALMLIVMNDDDEVIQNAKYRICLWPYLQHLVRIMVRASRISVGARGVGINDVTPQVVSDYMHKAIHDHLLTASDRKGPLR